MSLSELFSLDDSPGTFAQKAIRLLMLVNPTRKRITDRIALRQMFVDFLSSDFDRRRGIVALSALETDFVNKVFGELSNHPGIDITMGWAGWRKSQEISSSRAKEQIRRYLGRR